MTKYIYDLEGLMKQHDVDSITELKDLGYDVDEYLSRRKAELSDEMERLNKMQEAVDSSERSSETSHGPSYYYDDEPYIGSWDVCSEDYIGT